LHVNAINCQSDFPEPDIAFFESFLRAIVILASTIAGHDCLLYKVQIR